MTGGDELDCNYTAPTDSTPLSYPETTFEATTANTVQYTTPDGEPREVTTHRSRFSSQTPFQGIDTRTFRTSTGTDEFHHSTLSPAGHEDTHTDEGAVENSTEELYTRFGTRPTPGHPPATYEPTKPVPTDAPDHITHFFTEFPRTTAEDATTVSSVTESYFTTQGLDSTTLKTSEVSEMSTQEATTILTTVETTTTQITVTSPLPPSPPTSAHFPDIIASGTDCGECKNGGTCSLIGGISKVRT